jgi:hypothetical protein
MTQQVIAVQPPVRGLNTTGMFASMPPTDAVEMDNLISTDLGLTVRGGWREYATNVGDGSMIKTLMPYTSVPVSALAPPLANSTLFAANDKGIFNVEGGGNLLGRAAAMTLSGATDAGHMTYTQFTAGGGKQYLIACSETDGAFLYDGITWTKFTGSGSPGPGVVTGVDPAMFRHVLVWKHRLVFTKGSSGEAWWLPLDSVGGAAVVTDFGPNLQHGGMLLGLASWTQDAGAGIDDMLVMIGSAGDVSIYQGTGPTSLAQIGVWYIGQPPVGRRCWTNSGGNVYVLTQFGVVPIAEVVQGGLDNVLLAGTDLLQQLRKIQMLLNEDFQTLLNTPGWALIDVPSLALLHIARPAKSVSERIQYVFHQHSLAWSRILDMPGYSFSRRLNEMYAGTSDGRVLRVFDGDTDGQLIDGTGSYEIRARLTPAFNSFDTPAVMKRAQMFRPQFVAKAIPGYNVRFNVNYEINPLNATPHGVRSIGSLWDLAAWDSGLWSGGKTAAGEWRTVKGIGYALAPTLFISTMAPTTLVAMEYMTDSGGPL